MSAVSWNHDHHIEQRLRDAAALETFGRLAVGVTHDFKNLLQVIIGNLYLLESAVQGDATALQRVQVARRAAGRGADLIERLLALARPSHPRGTVVDAKEVARSLATLLERALGRNLTLSVGLAREPCPIEADPAQFESAIVNLVMNSRDATPAGGQVRLSVRRMALGAEAATALGLQAGDFVIIRVSDTGQGIPPELHKRVLEPFFTTKGQGKGSGLGLSMVQAFINDSGGKLSLQSRVGHGTTVTLYFPLATAGEIRDLNDTVLVRRTSSRHSQVIVADPEPEVRQVLVGMLQELGFSTIVVGSRTDVLKALDDHPRASHLLIDKSFNDDPGFTASLRRQLQRGAARRLVWMTSHSERVNEDDPGIDAPVLYKPIARGGLARALSATNNEEN